MTDVKRFQRSLNLALRHDDLVSAEKFLRNATENIKVDVGNKFLFKYIKSGNVPIVKLLFEYGINPNIRDDGGYAPMYYAIKQEDDDIIHLLMDYDVDLNMPIDNVCKNTPLICAVKHGNLDLVKILLDQCVNVHTQNEQGDTALYIAIDRLEDEINQCGDFFNTDIQIEIIKLLIQNGSDYVSPNQNGDIPGTLIRNLCTTQEFENIFGSQIGKVTKAAR